LARESLERLRGKFIVFDGVDGSGKGVQIRLLTEELTAAGIECVSTRDPGGTPIGDRIRHVLLDYDLSEMDVRCEALLFMASRAQLAGQTIEPTIAEGKKCLIVDRYVSATCAYQGAAGHDPKKVIQLAEFAIGKTWPDLTIIIDVLAETAAQRTARKTQAQRKKEQMYKNRSLEGHPMLFQDVHTDAMEARPFEFHQRVRQLFLELPSYYPSPVVIVDGQGTEQEVHDRVMEALVHASF
jgi:dTMP kinase